MIFRLIVLNLPNLSKLLLKFALKMNRLLWFLAYLSASCLSAWITCNAKLNKNFKTYCFHLAQILCIKNKYIKYAADIKRKSIRILTVFEA